MIIGKPSTEAYGIARVVGGELLLELMINGVQKQDHIDTNSSNLGGRGSDDCSEYTDLPAPSPAT